MGMKYRDPETGQFKDLKVKTSDTLPIGTQVAYGGAVPPTGWLICDGSAVSRTTYAELFKVIGTSYGAGDGSTTFNLPNKKGRVSAGYDSTNSKFNAIGKKLGEETHTLTVAELPKDFPKLQKSIAYDSGSTEAGFSAGEVKNYSSNEYKLKLSQNVFTSTGNGEPHNNIQPTEVDNWIIKAFQSIAVVGKVANTKTNSDDDTYSCNYVNGITKKNIMMINLDNVQTVTTDVETKVLFNKINFQLGDKLTFESNGIKIGAGVSKVRIDLTLWLEGHSADTYGAFYIVNSRAGVLTYNLKAYYEKIVWGTTNAYIYANVQEGDIIFANVRFSVAGNNNAIAGNYTNSCLLSVEVVE